MVQQIAAFPQFAPAQQETQAKPAQQKDPAESFSSLLGAKQEEQPSAEKPLETKPTDEAIPPIPEEEPDKATASNAIALSMSGLAAQFATQQAVQDLPVQEQQVDAVFAVSGAELAQSADPVSPEEAGMVLESVLPQEAFPDTQNVQKATPVQAGAQPLPQNPQEPTNQPVIPGAPIPQAMPDAPVQQPAFSQPVLVQEAPVQTVPVQFSPASAVPAQPVPAETVPVDTPVGIEQDFFAEASTQDVAEMIPQELPSPVKPSFAELQGKMEEPLPVSQQASPADNLPAQEASVLEQPIVQSFVQKEMPVQFRQNQSAPVRPAGTAKAQTPLQETNLEIPMQGAAVSAPEVSVKTTFAEQFPQTEEILPAQQPVSVMDGKPVPQEVLAQEPAVYTVAREIQLPAQKQDSSKVDLLSGSELAAAQAKPSVSYSDGNVMIPVTHEAAPTPQAQPAQQLAEQIQQSIDAGRKEFTMDLYPRDLGKVSVKLVSESGILTVEIAAANPKTQSLLLSGASEIKSLLQAEQPVQVVDASQNKQWYEEQQQQSRQDAQEQARQQQEEEQQKNRQRYESSFSTGDFLSVMQQLRAQAV